MRLLVVKDFPLGHHFHKAGRVISPGDGVGNVLIRRGLAVLADAPPKPAKETQKPKRK